MLLPLMTAGALCRPWVWWYDQTEKTGRFLECPGRMPLVSGCCRWKLPGCLVVRCAGVLLRRPPSAVFAWRGARTCRSRFVSAGRIFYRGPMDRGGNKGKTHFSQYCQRLHAHQNDARSGMINGHRDSSFFIDSFRQKRAWLGARSFFSQVLLAVRRLDLWSIPCREPIEKLRTLVASAG